MTLIVTWLWQGLAIAWITAAAVGAMPRLNAATRHAVWWLALAAVLAIPVAHGLARIITGTPSTPDLTGALDAAGVLMLPPIPGGVVACAVAIWAMTAAVGTLRIARSCRALGRLKRASSPFDRSREARLPLWVAARDEGHRAAELRTSDRMTGACALGLGRPAIVVSRSVADALSDESLDEIVMHEQAHLDRYDDWSQMLQAVVGSLAGLHPAVRFLVRRMDVDREAACDDRVVSRTGANRRYASSLLAAAVASSPKAGGVAFAAGVPTATTTASALRVRVGRLLDPRRDRSARLASATSLVSVTALALAVVLSTQLAPAVMFLEAVAVTPPAADASAIDVRRAPASRLKVNAQTRVNATAGRRKRLQRHTSARVTRPVHSVPPDAAVHPVAGKHETLDAPPTEPLESRVIAADVSAAALAVPSLSSPRAGIASAPPTVAPPWHAVSASTTATASGVAGAAVATAAHARNAGVSIGRFFTRAGKAVTKDFQPQ
jgi:beta-lactamase regulating signal transducer with metallopeptidase domain